MSKPADASAPEALESPAPPARRPGLVLFIIGILFLVLGGLAALTDQIPFIQAIVRPSYSQASEGYRLLLQKGFVQVGDSGFPELANIINERLVDDRGVPAPVSINCRKIEIENFNATAIKSRAAKDIPVNCLLSNGQPITGTGAEFLEKIELLDVHTKLYLSISLLAAGGLCVTGGYIRRKRK